MRKEAFKAARIFSEQGFRAAEVWMYRWLYERKRLHCEFCEIKDESCKAQRSGVWERLWLPLVEVGQDTVAKPLL